MLGENADMKCIDMPMQRNSALLKVQQCTERRF
jgi:hypothetical protein